MNRVTLIVLLCVFGWASAAGAAPPAVPAVNTITTIHFSVHYLHADRESAEQVAMLAEPAFAHIARDLHAPRVGKITILVYRDRRQFNRAIERSPRDLVLGIAQSSRRLIQVDVSGLLGDLAVTVPHEVAHIVLADALGPDLDKLPLWLNEGIAQYESGGWDPGARRRAAELVGRGPIPLASLDAAFAKGGDAAGDAYLQSMAMVAFLVDQKGRRVLGNLVRALREEPDLEAAVQRSAGWALAEWVDRWERASQSSWRWALLLQSSDLAFGLMTILAIVGFIVARRRHVHHLQQLAD
jgi:hypothetical protein